jgi:hypothetical protein
VSHGSPTNADGFVAKMNGQRRPAKKLLVLAPHPFIGGLG